MENSCPHQPGVPTLDFYTRNKTTYLFRKAHKYGMFSFICCRSERYPKLHSYTSIGAISIWQSMGNYYLDTEDINSSKIQLID